MQFNVWLPVTHDEPAINERVLIAWQNKPEWLPNFGMRNVQASWIDDRRAYWATPSHFMRIHTLSEVKP